MPEEPLPAALRFGLRPGDGIAFRAEAHRWRFTPRPRLYGIGPGKSGTHALASLFRGLPTAHEPEAAALIEALLAYEAGPSDWRSLLRFVVERERRLGLAVDVANLNIFLVDLLVALDPQARFVLTIRDPCSWLDSILNHYLRHQPTAQWRAFADHRFGRDGPHPPEEAPLRELGLHPLAGYLRYWRAHLEHALAHVPPERLLVVRVERIAAEAGRIAAFAAAAGLAVDPGALAARGAEGLEEFRNTSKQPILLRMPAAHVEEQVRRHCEPLLGRLYAAGVPPGDPVREPPPAARPEVEALQAYSAPLEGRRGLLRLDFNENTVGPSPQVVAAIRAIPAEEYAIYPEYDGLRQALIASLGGSATGLTPPQVGIFNGVDAALHACFHAYGAAGDRLLTTSPTFGYYTPCARMQGMEIEALPHRLPGFLFPFEEMLQALRDRPPKLLLLCNPNNPTGTRLAPQRVLELAAAAPGTLVVVDELYEAFSGDSVLPPLIAAAGGEDPFAAHHNLLVLRSLSKTAGIAGLRIGFALGAAPLIDRVGRVTGPYDVNSFAVAAAYAALADQPYVDAYVAEVLAARDALVTQLRRAGVRHHVDGGNYLLLWPAQDPAEVERRLKDEAAILVRSMAGKPQIDGSLRVSLGTREQMERFWQAWRAVEGL